MDDINDFAAFGEKLADASGEIVLSYWRSQLEVIRKSDESPVTRADTVSYTHLTLPTTPYV